MKTLERAVYPSTEPTVYVVDDPIYGGAHEYVFTECLGFEGGKTQYGTGQQILRFVRKEDNGCVMPGLQSEQLVIALLDRQQKLNARFPSPFSDKAIRGLEMFLEAQQERVDDRLKRGVMGALKK